MAVNSYVNDNTVKESKQRKYKFILMESFSCSDMMAGRKVYFGMEDLNVCKNTKWNEVALNIQFCFVNVPR